MLHTKFRGNRPAGSGEEADQHLFFRFIDSTLYNISPSLNRNAKPLAIFFGCTARLSRTWSETPRQGFSLRDDSINRHNRLRTRKVHECVC